MIFSCLEAIVCTPYSQESPKSQFNQQFSQLKSIERGPWQKLGIRPMQPKNRRNKNKIIFVHEQVRLNFEPFSAPKFYKK